MGVPYCITYLIYLNDQRTCTSLYVADTRMKGIMERQRRSINLVCYVKENNQLHTEDYTVQEHSAVLGEGWRGRQVSMAMSSCKAPSANNII